MKPGELDLLHTERLVLRRPTRADLPDLLRMYRDPDVMATLGGVRTAAETEATLARLIGHWDAHNFGYWIAREPGTDRFAGRAGLHHVVANGRAEVELGSGFLSEHWGRGLATEVAVASVRAAFDVIGLDEIVCFTTPSNARSRAVMEKAGFRYECDFTWAGVTHRLCRLDRERWRTGADPHSSA